MEWWIERSGAYDLFVSGEVVAELSAAESPVSGNALKMLEGLNMLDLRPEVQKLAHVLVEEKVMPAPAVAGDAMHVAAATVHRMDYMLTWNVRHLANPNKRTHLAVVCLRLGLVPPQLVTPDIL